MAWGITRKQRNWWMITDENPEIIYLKSTLGRAAYHIPTGRNVAPGDWRPLYKGQAIQPSRDPWAVDPWLAWSMGQRGGRGSAPLQADGNRVLVDFVGPAYLQAFLDAPVVVLPFAPKTSKTTMQKPAKQTGGKKKGA